MHREVSQCPETIKGYCKPTLIATAQVFPLVTRSQLRCSGYLHYRNFITLLR